MSNIKSYIILIPIFFVVLFKSTANVAFFHYGIEQGLPEVRVVSISQDSAGFVWFAGENSLYRFDGDRFRSYQHSGSSTAESIFGTIFTLYTDSRGTLWVGSSTGLTWYDSRGDLFLRPKQGWSKEDVNDISEDSGGNLWLATDAGLARVDVNTMETTWYSGTTTENPTENNVLPVTAVNRLTCQHNGKIWFSDYENNLFLFDPVSLKTENFSSIAGVDIDFGTISEIRHSNNRLLISTLNQGFYWYDAAKKELKNENFSAYGRSIHHFTPVDDSILWLTGNNGLFRFNLETQTYTRFTEEEDNPLSLTRTAVTFVYEDRENNLWISSGLRGVDYALINTPFQHFPSNGNGPYQLSQPEVTAIEFDNENNMWLGYEGGYIEKHSHSPIKNTTFIPSAKNNTGAPGSIFTIFPDSKNRVWFGGWNSGLQKFNPESSSFDIAPILPDSLALRLRAADIRDLVEDSEGNLWISFHGIGLGRYEPDTYQMELFRHNPASAQGSLSNDWIFNICIDNENNLWAATSHGVSRLNLEEKTFENYYFEENNPQSLNHSYVNTIYCDPAGTIWAGTDNGLNVYIPSLNTFIPVLNNADNSSYSISAIRSTKPGEVWASTKTGIIGLSWSWDSLQKGVLSNIRFFNRRSGLLSTSYFTRSAAVNNEGIIFFGGNEGIDFFNSAQASAFQFPNPKPVLTDLVIDGLPVWFDNREENSVNLDHKHRMISIRFAAPTFYTPEQQKFRYQLEGFDNKWNYTQYEKVATYTNLPAGAYTFRVETQDSNGNWVPDSATLSIVVKPPFWNTLPFYILVVVVIAFFIFLIIYARSRIFLIRQKELEKIIESRTRELLYNNAELEKINQTKNKLFSIISHDLRSPFAGVLGILQLLADEESGMAEERKNELLVMAKKSAENTFELLENLLTWAHSQMKNTVSKSIRQNLSTLLDKNIELKKTSAQQKEIELVPNFPQELTASFDRDMINTVIRNLLNNAVKFTHPGGKIEISGFRENGEVTVSIADTGIGIDHEDTETIFHDGNISKKGTLGEKGTGLGLIICREFVEKNAGKIWVTPNQPKGTVFYFTLPAN